CALPIFRSAASPGSVGSAGRHWRKWPPRTAARRRPAPIFPCNLRGWLEACARARNMVRASRLQLLKIKAPDGRLEQRELLRPVCQIYLILASLNSTCLRAIGSYLRLVSLSVIVRLFFLVT